MKKTDKKSLAEGCPALVQEEWFWDFNNVLGLNPHRISTSNGKPAFWKCPRCGSIYLMTTKKRLECNDRNKTSCFTCRGRIQIHPFIV